MSCPQRGPGSVARGGGPVNLLLQRSQGFAIAKDTLHQLIGHLEDAFLIRTVWIESSSERQRRVNPRKTYPIDPGLIQVFDRSGRVNLGHALETVVQLELERRGFTTPYLRTPSGRAVDFLARHPGGPTELIQVCAVATAEDTLERELAALEEAAELHPRATRRLLTATRDALPPRQVRGVIAQPAYEWILDVTPK